MKDKLLKGIKFLVITFLLIGSAFLLPLKNEDLVEAQENFQIEVNSNSDSLWSQTVENVNSYSLSQIEIYNSVAYKISNATELAYMAYMVNSGNSAYSSSTFALTNNIDLSGSLWTPIGTKSNPFKGTFYGRGYEISNISINEYSCDSDTNSGAAFFGVISNAVIGDVTLSGWQQINVNNTRKIASLVSEARSSYIINCYDIAVKTDKNGNSFDGVASADSSSYIYRGGRRYMPATSTYKNYTLAEIADFLTVGYSYATEGYVGVYTFKEGSFMIGDREWFTPDYVKVLLDNSFNETNITVKTIYRGNKPTVKKSAISAKV